MNKKISIAIDAMGGDNSPDKTIKGIKLFLDKNSSEDDFFLNIFGKKELIYQKIKEYNINSKNISIFDSKNTISNDETPLTAIKTSKDTSMWSKRLSGRY